MTSKIYKIPYTDTNSGELSVPRRIFIDDMVDITLIGKRTLEYGQVFNENILHLMEHFACNSDANDLNIPDANSKLASVLNNPIEGQLWFSKTVSRLFVYSNDQWKDFNVYNSVAGNSGFLYDGELIPVPVDANGNNFELSDCAIYVSPVTMYENIESFRCNVDSNGYLVCKYTPVNGVERSGHATFIIIGRMAPRIST